MWQELLLICSLHLVAAASPGPDFVLVSQQSVKHGRLTGLWVSLGITLGLSVHILYSAFGLAALISTNTAVLWGIKLLGAGYLLYLGIGALRSQGLGATQAVLGPKPSVVRSLAMGGLCNVLNPKAPLYFLSVFSLVISPQTPWQHLLIFASAMMLIQFLWFALVTLLFSSAFMQAWMKRASKWIDRVVGGLFVTMGLGLLFTTQK